MQFNAVMQRTFMDVCCASSTPPAGISRLFFEPYVQDLGSPGLPLRAFTTSELVGQLPSDYQSGESLMQTPPGYLRVWKVEMKAL